MISNNDPFVRAVANGISRGLLAICVNDEPMGGDSRVGLNMGKLYEIRPTGSKGERGYGVNGYGWQHYNHFSIIKLIQCIDPLGEQSLELGKNYEVDGGYFYDQQAYVWLHGLQSEFEGNFALAWGGFRFNRFSIEMLAK